MSLESKIEALTHALNALNVTLTTTQLPLPLEQPPEIAEEAPKESLQITEKELKAKCLEVAKTIKDGKNKVKDLLRCFGVTKVSEVFDEDRNTVFEKLEELE